MAVKKNKTKTAVKTKTKTDAAKKIKAPKKAAKTTKKTVLKNVVSRSFPVRKEERVEDYWRQLNNVLDPELGIGIVDLGLVYDVKVEGKNADIIMTFTSMGCPVGPNILARVRYEMEMYPGVEDVNIQVVWQPVWNRDFIDPDIRTLMFDQ